ncbi:hypothetical protein H5410_022640, partial [Solanum commersonii]
KNIVEDAHHKVDAVVEDVINEHKKNIAIGKTNGALGGEDLIDDMFAAVTETSLSTLVWAMVRMMKNPSVFAKAQAAVREAFKDKETFDENDVEELKYLKLVIKETLRLHPPVPLLVPRECREETDINGYTIPVKTKVMVNVWALGKDPKYWDDAESFKPRDLSSALSALLVTILSIFPLAVANVYLPLAQLLYNFDWKLPNGMEPKDLNLTELVGVTAARKDDLILVATPYQPPRQ